MAILAFQRLTCLTKLGQASARVCCALAASLLRCSIVTRVWSSFTRLQSNSSQFGWFHGAHILVTSPAMNFATISSPPFSRLSVSIYGLVNISLIDSGMPDRSSNLHNRFSQTFNVADRDLEKLKLHFCDLCGKCCEQVAEVWKIG